jgi:hypothetical protein
LDLAVELNGRRLLIEVITPYPAERMTSGGFAPWDSYVTKNIDYEIEEHFEGVSQPTDPLLVAVNGLHRGLLCDNIQSAIGDLYGRTKLFVSAILLFASNYGRCLVSNPAGLQLTDRETSELVRIFRLQPNRGLSVKLA